MYVDPHVENKKFILHYGDLTDSTNIIKLVQQIQPDEIYNLGAQSHVAVSFETPEYTANCDALGTLRILEAIRLLKLEKKTKFYQASTSELYGLIKQSPQNEQTPFYPRSPYAAAKLYAHFITVNYREAYGIFACNGILFNHESPRRGETFVTKKIIKTLVNIDKGLEKCLFLGNINSKRDWGHARDYVEMMWKMLQLTKPEDFVIATGRMESVRRFCELSAIQLGWSTSVHPNGIIWVNKGFNEIGKRADTQEVVIKIDPRYYRPSEVDELLGDSTKAREKLGWIPSTSLESLIKEMISAEKKDCINKIEENLNN
tara:strand:- start:44 stop:991 length:948 start_codon:yes stop_codon:yes gene_type:complete